MRKSVLTSTSAILSISQGLATLLRPWLIDRQHLLARFARGGPPAIHDHDESNNEPPSGPQAVSDPIFSATQIDVATANQQSTILVGEGLGEQLAPLLDRHGVGRKRFVVSSPVIWRHQGARIQAAVPGEPILIADGERYKTLASVAASSATPPALPRPASCAASPWCTCRRRCWRR